jgi:exopolysaccharide biosynthesis polyprenyl glycosylphosphotransferase
MNGTAARRSPSPSKWAHSQSSTAWPSIDGQLGPRALSGRERVGLVRQLSYVAIDVGMVCLGGVLVFWLNSGLRSFTAAPMYPGLLFLYAALVVLSCQGQDLYRTPKEQSAIAETFTVVKAVGIATALFVLFVFASGNREISRVVVIYAGALNVLTLAGWRYAKRLYVFRRALHGEYASRVLIVGAGKASRAFASWLEANRHLGYSVAGFLDAHPNRDARVLGSVHDLARVSTEQFVDQVFVPLPTDREVVKQVFLEARRLRLDLNVVPDIYDGLGWHAPVHAIGGFPVLELHGQPIPALGLAIKRAIDVVVATLGLILTAPLLLIAALCISLGSPGPVLYTAQRVGRKGKKFRCYKLRTMVQSADQEKEALRAANERTGPFFKIEHDPRVTRCGVWLRKLSVDELPQLVNVILGDMSLVGPRPHPVDDFELYRIEDLRRLDVKPGLTGLWQITARRDPSFEASMVLDLQYIETWSLALDLRILVKTVPALFRAQGN